MDGALKSLSVKSATLLGGGDSVSLAPSGLGDVMEEEELFGDEVDPDLSLDRHIAKVKCTKKYWQEHSNKNHAIVTFKL